MVVAGHGRDQLEKALGIRATIAVQEPQLGTGHPHSVATCVRCDSRSASPPSITRVQPVTPPVSAVLRGDSGNSESRFRRLTATNNAIPLFHVKCRLIPFLMPLPNEKPPPDWTRVDRNSRGLRVDQPAPGRVMQPSNYIRPRRGEPCRRAVSLSRATPIESYHRPRRRCSPTYLAPPPPALAHRPLRRRLR